MRTLIAVVGPTASGKTEIGLKICLKNNASIISCDAMQVYRFMDIGTAKPDPKTRKMVPHYMIDIVNPDEGYTACDYSKDAREIIEKIDRAIIVGGSGLYLKALAEGLFSLPQKIDPKVRKRLSLRETNDLYDELKRVDRETADKLHPNDRVRIMRAVEVYRATGTPISSWRKNKEPEDFKVKYIGVDIKRDELSKRIETRVDKMIENGLLDEAKSLLERFGEVTPLGSIGYKEITCYLKGEETLKRAIELIKTNTKNYAKRQITWFRGIETLKWLPPRKIEKMVIHNS